MLLKNEYNKTLFKNRIVKNEEICYNNEKRRIERRYTMNKSELVAAIVEKTGSTKKDAEAIMNATFEAISDALANGDKVSLIGFGNFEVRERAAREGKNPQTGEKIQIAACKVPAFKPGKALKDRVK